MTMKHDPRCRAGRIRPPARWARVLAAAPAAAIAAAVAFAAGVLHAAQSPPPAARPNVLFLFSDDQRADTIAALGNSFIRTPNLDRLVRDGVTFSRAYCMGAEQGAVCVPSRAMLMTGRTLFHVKDNLAGQTTWPEAFGRSGYATFITGKWHNQAESALRSFQEGKAVFLGGMGDPYKLPIQDISPQHTFVNKRTSGQHSVKLFADAAIEFLRRPKGGRPFLCYVAFNAPHDPRVAPQRLHDFYNARKPPAPANFLPQHPFNNGFMRGRDEELAPWPRTPEIVRQHLADYYASIEFVDHEIGRILAALEETGQHRNTIVVFAADQGLAIGSHGLFGKQNLYEHSMRAPLVFSGPGIPRGQKTDAMCYLFDVFPTLGELAAVQGPEGSEGRSMVPIITGRQVKGRDSIFTAFMKVQRAVRDDRWKLIVYPRVNKTQLFDLQEDPIEMKDLAGDPRYAGEVARLKGLLQNWQREVGDVQPLSTTKPDPLELDLSKAGPAKKKKIIKP